MAKILNPSKDRKEIEHLMKEFGVTREEAEEIVRYFRNGGMEPIVKKRK